MIAPNFRASNDGLFRFDAYLAQSVAFMVALEVSKRFDIIATPDERNTWAALFDSVVTPDYGRGHTFDEMADLEKRVQKFVVDTAANYSQLGKLKALLNGDSSASD